MKVLFDSNILIDVILHRSDFFTDSRDTLLLAESKKITGYISASSITDIHYIIRKELHVSVKALKTIKKLLQIFKVAKVDTKTITEAVNSEWKDFEDCVQFCAAKRCGVKCIITRNTKDFEEATIPVMTPKEFLNNI